MGAISYAAFVLLEMCLGVIKDPSVCTQGECLAQVMNGVTGALGAMQNSVGFLGVSHKATGQES